MSRASRVGTETIERVRVGDPDPASHAARHACVPLCSAVHPKKATPCTRAAGHDESGPRHPSTPHVTTNAKYVATAVWL